MKKKFWAMLTLAIMLAFGVAQGAWAATVASGECGAEGDNVTWVLDDAGTLTISGTGEIADIDDIPWELLRYCNYDIKVLQIENGVTTITEGMFQQGYGIVSIKIPASVTKIGNGNFLFSRNLQEIVVDENNLNYCSVENVLFDKNKTTLIKYAAAKPDVVYTIPDSVTKIEPWSFCAGYNLKEVILPENLECITGFAFDGCRSLQRVNIPPNCIFDEFPFIGCISLNDFVWDNRNSNYIYENGVVFSADKKTLLFCLAGKEGEYTVPDSVQNIGEYAFFLCKNLTAINVSDSVTNIDGTPFSGCDNLLTVNLPSKLTTLNGGLISSCPNLRAVYIPVSLSKTSSPNNGIYSVFWNCPNLNDIYYEGTEEQWHNISKIAIFFIPEQATIHYNSQKIYLVTSLTLNRSEISLLAGGNAQLQATVSEGATNKNVTWTSNNTTVATVNETGKVMAVSAGEAVITATAADGSGQKAECKVTVNGTAAPAEAIYTITFDTDGGTMAGPSFMQVTKETKVTMPTAEKSGYNFKYWQDVANSSQTYAANNVYSFAADTELKAIWERRSSGGSSGGGGGSSRPTTKPGTTTETKPGTESSKPGTSSGSKEITAANIATVFGDVQNNAWYSEAIAYVYNNGMMNGTEKGFEPNAATTRAMIVTMLHRLNGTPAAGAAGFADVAGGQWYSEAVAWAAANGVVNGYSETKFAPNEEITREQLAAILYRYTQFKGLDVNAKGDLSGFADGAAVSGWAQEAMQWAVGAGLLSGNADGTLAPAAGATRAEVAMILMRFMQG